MEVVYLHGLYDKLSTQGQKYSTLMFKYFFFICTYRVDPDKKV